RKRGTESTADGQSSNYRKYSTAQCATVRQLILRRNIPRSACDKHYDLIPALIPRLRWGHLMKRWSSLEQLLVTLANPFIEPPSPSPSDLDYRTEEAKDARALCQRNRMIAG